MTVLLLSLTAVFMFVLIRKYLGSKISFVIQLAWIVSYPKLPLPPALPWSSVFSTLFLVLAIVAFRSAILNTNRKIIALNGFCAGLLVTSSVLFRIQIVLSLVFILILLIINTKKYSLHKEFTIFFTVGTVLTATSILLIFAKLGMIDSYVLQCIIWPREFYGNTYLPNTIFTKSGLVYYSSWYIYPVMYFIFQFVMKHNSKNSKILFILLMPIFYWFYYANIDPKSYLNPLLQFQWLVQKIPLGMSYFATVYLTKNIFKSIKNIKSIKFITFETLIGLAALLQLYPGNGTDHLWWITPIILVVVVPLLAIDKEYNKNGFGPFFTVFLGIILISLVTLLGFFNVNRTPFQSEVLSQMKGISTEVKVIDETIAEVVYLSTDSKIIFDCADGLYAVSNGSYLPSNKKFVNWGPYNIDMPKVGDILFLCNATEFKIDEIKSSNRYDLIKMISFPDGRINAFYRMHH